MNSNKRVIVIWELNITNELMMKTVGVKHADEGQKCGFSYKKLCLVLGIIQLCFTSILWIYNPTILSIYVTETLQAIKLKIRQSQTRPCTNENSDKSESINIHSTIGMFKPEIIVNSIAIGLAITTRGTKWTTKHEINSTFPFFTTFLPSFCATASAGYSYHFFLAYDKNDPFYTKAACIEQFKQLFHNYTGNHCPSDGKYTVRLLLSKYVKQPARSQNEAMMDAYMSNMEYFHRTNDDTRINTSNWTTTFINTLKGFKPSKIGVVGPSHTGGNTEIMTYDFVHYTHIEIHGFYYPHIFTDWFADDWITKVYLPNNSLKLKSVKVQHTMEKGTRYRGHLSFRKIIGGYLASGKEVIKRYISLTEANKEINATGDKIISMSLSDSLASYTFNTAIRNAQLLPLYFPHWKLRIYTTQPKSGNITSIKDYIHRKTINKLLLLGAQVWYLPHKVTNIIQIPSLWKYFILDDATVNYFMIKDSENSFKYNDSTLVKQWIQNNTNSYLCYGKLCSADKEKQKPNAVKNSNILFGGKTGTSQTFLGKSISKTLVEYVNNMKSGDIFEQSFLKNVLWRKLRTRGQ